MALELPPEICSRADVRTLALQLKSYASWLAHSEVKKRLKIKKSGEVPNLTPAASEVLRDWSAKNPMTSTSLSKLVESLDALEKSAPSLTITLAAPVTGSLKKSLAGWCRKNIASDILVSFEFNSSLLGGMVLRYKSSIFDWSFRRALLENSSKFTEALASV